MITRQYDYQRQFIKLFAYTCSLFFTVILYPHCYILFFMTHLVLALHLNIYFMLTISLYVIASLNFCVWSSLCSTLPEELWEQYPFYQFLHTDDSLSVFVLFFWKSLSRYEILGSYFLSLSILNILFHFFRNKELFLLQSFGLFIWMSSEYFLFL